MTFTKEQVSQAFIDVLNERVPDLSHIPDHVFSERFEKKMNKLIRREAAHPWAVSHTLARNLIAAAIVIILLFTFCMSVSAIRNAIFNFFRQHFEAHDKIIFELPDAKNIIEDEYTIIDLPEGYTLVKKEKNNAAITESYSNDNGDIIFFSQRIIPSNSLSLDNERSQYDEIIIDNHGLFISTKKSSVSLLWDYDGYVFTLEIIQDGPSVDEAIELYLMVKPIQ